MRKLVVEYKKLLEKRNAIAQKFAIEVYAKFDDFYPVWSSGIRTIAEIDALLALAKASKKIGKPACRPTFIEEDASDRSVIEFEELRHPSVVSRVATDFIPNDVFLGGQDPSVIVLTGPNMGDKGTLLRQTCVAIILAQLGCYGPAKSCRLTPFDRIYTFVGANDSIIGAEDTSTIEAVKEIFEEATPRSMVTLDELERGTSTFDGYAVAQSALVIYLLILVVWARLQLVI